MSRRWILKPALAVTVLSLIVLAPAVASSPLAATVAPKLKDMPADQGWLLGPSPTFNPHHPGTLFCKGRSPSFADLGASQVAFRLFATPTLVGLVTTTLVFNTVDDAHSWYAHQLRPGFASCIIRGEQLDQAVMGAPQGVPGDLKLVHSATPALQVGAQAYELRATFRQSTGDPMYELWAVARYGRVVFVLHGFWFSGGTPINPGPILVKVIARTPSR